MLRASDIMSVTEAKGNASNLVTKYDREVQAFLEERLHRILPEARFLGEENHEDLFREEFRKGWLLVIDPIDGTSNFIYGYRPSVISVALMKDGQSHLGIIYNPYENDLFSAEKGCGALRNGKPMFSSELSLSKSLVSMGTAPYYENEKIRYAFDTALSYMSRCVDVRRSGSAAYDLCMVACGTLGLFFEPVLQLWDYAAGALIVEEAGGVVTDMTGGKLSYSGPSSVIAAGHGVSSEDYLPKTVQ